MDNRNDARIVVANPSTTTVLILDDDGECCTLFDRSIELKNNIQFLSFIDLKRGGFGEILPKVMIL